MTNYNNGKIYKIEPIIEHDEEDIYIGSTTQEYLSQRMTKHRTDYKLWKDGEGNKTTIFNLFDKYGLENCKIVLIESCLCNSNDELKSRESYYINLLKCVNKCIPLTNTDKLKEQVKIKNEEYHEANKEYLKDKKKKYYEANKEKLKNNKKEYYEANKEQQKELYEAIKEQINNKQKEYREKNKEQIKDKSKEYYEKNKQKIKDRESQIINCVCGCNMSKGYMSTHLKTKKHINYVNNKNIIEL